MCGCEGYAKMWMMYPFFRDDDESLGIQCQMFLEKSYFQKSNNVQGECILLGRLLSSAAQNQTSDPADCSVVQGCTNPRCQVTQVTKFYMVVPNICGYSVWNFHHVTLLVPRILKF
jgi:hypothetical protein